MRLTRLLRASVFRLTIVYAAVFGVSVVALVGLIFVRTIDVIDSEADDQITAEIAAMGARYAAEGIPGVIDAVEDSLGNAPGTDTLYLLAGPDGERLVGNLLNWPREVRRDGEWVVLDLQRVEAARVEPAYARARIVALPGGFQLLVGRDIREREAFERLMLEALGWASIVTVVLGLGGGFLLARRVLGRIDTIAATAATIMRGDLKRRIPLAGTGDEFDRLGGQLNAMLQEIERLVTAMREVSDNVAHDLRRPLTHLRNRLESLAADLAAEDPRGEGLRGAVADVDSVIATFNALLAIARAEAAAPESMQPVDLAEVAADAAELYRPLAEEKGIALEVAAMGPLTVRGHRALLDQAVVNLIDNALKYAPAGGRVAVTAQVDGAGIVIVVADNGPGVPPEARSRVLQRFVRLDASRNTTGSGLGLSLVDSVVRLHGGTLALGDNNPGLRVTIRLPRAEAGPGAAL